MDNLERAVAALGDQGRGRDRRRPGDGARPARRAPQRARGARRSPRHGEAFDPTVHEAIASVPSPQHDEGTIIEVVEKGYRHSEHVLRPTRVVIAATRPPARRRRASREREPRPSGRPLRHPRRRRAPRAPTRSRRRTASWRGCTTRTPTRTTRRPRSASRRSPTPTTCSRTPRSAREYDARLLASAGARPNGGRAGRAAGAGGRLRRLRRHVLDDLPRRAAAAPRGRGRTGRPTGADVEVEVNLSFDQAMAGAQVPVSVETPVACADCGGSGAKPGTNPRLCPECKGRGVRGRDVGSFAFSEPCPRCGGNGTVIDDPCPTCSRLRHHLHPLADQGQDPAGRQGRHPDPRQGHAARPASRGGPAGDLYVRHPRVAEPPVHA